jgi:methyl-accepting chemotaxis protein
MVSTIQAETQRTVQAITRNRDAAGAESRRSGETGEHLDSITEMTRRVGEMIVQIAGAATAETGSMRVIRENIDRMAQVGETTAREAGQSAEACRNLSGLAMKLASLVGEFHLKGESPAAAGADHGSTARRPLRAKPAPDRSAAQMDFDSTATLTAV